MKRLTLVAVAAAASLLAHSPAFAAATSSASLSDLTIQLVDLNPLDGITPWISFAGQSGVLAMAFNSNPLEGDLNPIPQYGATAFDSVSAVTGTSQSMASAASNGSTQVLFSGTSTLAGWLSASGNAQGTTSSSPGADYSEYGAGAGWNTSDSSFTLSQYTVVVFTANATTSASTTVPHSNSPDNSESALASAVLAVSGPDGLREDKRSVSVDNLPSAPESATNDGPLSVFYVNATGANQVGDFGAYVLVQGFSHAAAVPEPESYAMMLAGLGALGFVARRRQHKG